MAVAPLAGVVVWLRTVLCAVMVLGWAGAATAGSSYTALVLARRSLPGRNESRPNRLHLVDYRQWD